MYPKPDDKNIAAPSDSNLGPITTRDDQSLFYGAVTDGNSSAALILAELDGRLKQEKEKNSIETANTVSSNVDNGARTAEQNSARELSIHFRKLILDAHIGAKDFDKALRDLADCFRNYPETAKLQSFLQTANKLHAIDNLNCLRAFLDAGGNYSELQKVHER